MPNLYNTNLGQNARNVRVGDSKFGTRRLQFYTVYVYGLTDVEAAKLQGNMFDPDSNLRQIIEDSDINFGMGGIGDQPPAYEYRGPTILEAIVRGVQKTSEVYSVCQPEVLNTDPDWWDLTVTIAVAHDTMQSAWEQIQGGLGPGVGGQNVNPNADWIINNVGDAIDFYDPVGGWDGLDVVATFIGGDNLYSFSPVALPADHETRQAVRQAQKAAIMASSRSLKGPRHQG